jgi:hypothetical protein
VPTALGVYVTEQLPLLKVQLVAGLKVPDPELVNETVPVGVDVVPDAVSLTVAVQVDPWETGIEEELQLTLVDVERAVTFNARPIASELFAWTESLVV